MTKRHAKHVGRKAMKAKRDREHFLRGVNQCDNDDDDDDVDDFSFAIL